MSELRYVKYSDSDPVRPPGSRSKAPDSKSTEPTGSSVTLLAPLWLVLAGWEEYEDNVQKI